ncbi:PAS domain-containing hybrid sensor histidine kinase/response regulator [Nocardioides sp. SYSU D00038]|uniref:PAS domain-containing sensor histidine kinase n=1 Tax=Nocardioides sp. SYSU D00038 TaxID=2812554 RepID=UPI001967EDD2|nr:PAS domain-containing hybrid sensor histidine kinase/response regulator [Nocardioides sp. SYSU D00038]
MPGAGQGRRAGGPRRHRDALLAVVAAVVAFTASWGLGLAEGYDDWASEHDHELLDALAFGLVVLLLGLSLAGWRRGLRARDDAERAAATDRALSETAERYRSLFDYHPHGVFTVDLEGRFGSANPACERISGWTTEELEGTPFLELLREEDRGPVLELFGALLDRRPQQFEASILHRSGRPVPLSLTGLPIVVDDEVVGVYGIAEDISQRAQMQARLADARVTAERATEAKSRFLATMSHEIRTPLTSVLASLELLRETELDDEQRELTRIMDRSGVRLLRLVDDILDYSRLEAGAVAPEAVPFAVRDLLDETTVLLRPQAERKGVVVSAVADPDLPAPVVGDVTRILQVLTNLAGNSVKFTDEGWVRLSADLQSRRGDVAEVLFKVVDSGMGLGEDVDATEIFDSFTQGDPSVPRRFGGTGLGLAIAKEAVTLMGGSIWAEAHAHGRGATFSFQLPLRVTPDRRATG